MKKFSFTPRTKLEDGLCVMLARAGLSYKLIQQKTGLNYGQINYRLKITDSKLRNYRNGKTELAQRVIEVMDKDTKYYLEAIRKELRNREK